MEIGILIIGMVVWVTGGQPQEKKNPEHESGIYLLALGNACSMHKDFW